MLFNNIISKIKLGLFVHIISFINVQTVNIFKKVLLLTYLIIIIVQMSENFLPATCIVRQHIGLVVYPSRRNCKETQNADEGVR